jgi:hypothetical protein
MLLPLAALEVGSAHARRRGAPSLLAEDVAKETVIEAFADVD